MASSSSNENEREEKWMSLLNHIVDVHTHTDNQLFMKCEHGVLERAWLKAGNEGQKGSYTCEIVKDESKLQCFYKIIFG